jgi:hypothetical protein
MIKKKAAHRAAFRDYCQSGWIQWRPLSEPLLLLEFRPEEPDHSLLPDELLPPELPRFELLLPLMPLLPELRPLGLLVPCSAWPIFLPNSRLLPSLPCRSETPRFTLPADVGPELSLLILSRLRLSITTSLSIG